MFGFMLLDVGKFHYKLDVLLVKCLVTFPLDKVQIFNESLGWVNRCFLLCILCDFCYRLSQCFHLYCCFIKSHIFSRCVGSGILVRGGSGGSGAWGGDNNRVCIEVGGG